MLHHIFYYIHTFLQKTYSHLKIPSRFSLPNLDSNIRVEGYENVPNLLPEIIVMVVNFWVYSHGRLLLATKRPYMMLVTNMKLDDIGL